MQSSISLEQQLAVSRSAASRGTRMFYGHTDGSRMGER